MYGAISRAISSKRGRKSQHSHVSYGLKAMGALLMAAATVSLLPSLTSVDMGLSLSRAGVRAGSGIVSPRGRMAVPKHHMSAAPLIGETATQSVSKLVRNLKANAVEAASPPKEISANAPEDQDKSLLPTDIEFGVPEIREKFERVLMEAQDDICKAIEELDGKAKFQADRWIKTTGGGGRSRVLMEGNVFEKAGINLSVLKGALPYEFVSKRGECKGFEPGEKIPYIGMGLSSVIHPRNPFAPTMHFNYRLFQTECGVWWFGGGTDITPSYIDKDDMKHFHGMYKEVCDKHDPEFYPKFKKWADEYFRITHRGETRGLGGIFSDDMNDRKPEELLAFYTDCVNSVKESYIPIVEKHKDDEFTPEQKQWQGIRRGRYAEFNLIYDRGTIFGLKQALNTERILMSLPLEARWEYDFQIQPG